MQRQKSDQQIAGQTNYQELISRHLGPICKRLTGMASPQTLVVTPADARTPEGGDEAYGGDRYPVDQRGVHLWLARIAELSHSQSPHRAKSRRRRRRRSLGRTTTTPKE